MRRLRGEIARTLSGRFFPTFYLAEAQFVQRGLGGDLAGVLFIIGFALGNKLSVHDRAYREEPPSSFHSFIEGLEFEVLAVLVGPAIEFVLMIDLEVLEIVQEKIRVDDPFDNPLAALVKTLVEIDGPDDGFEGITKDLAHLEAAVEFIEIADLLQPHFDGDIVQ